MWCTEWSITPKRPIRSISVAILHPKSLFLKAVHTTTDCTMAPNGANTGHTEDMPARKSGLVCPNLLTGKYEFVEVLKQRPSAISFIDLPGELRNKIYHYTLLGGVHTIRNTAQHSYEKRIDGIYTTRYKGTGWDSSFNIFTVHSAIHREAKSYFTSNATVYLPKLNAPRYSQELRGDPKWVQKFFSTCTNALENIRSIRLQKAPEKPTAEVLLRNGGRLPNGASRRIAVLVNHNVGTGYIGARIGHILCSMNEGSYMELTICFPR